MEEKGNLIASSSAEHRPTHHLGRSTTNNTVINNSKILTAIISIINKISNSKRSSIRYYRPNNSKLRDCNNIYTIKSKDNIMIILN